MSNASFAQGRRPLPGQSSYRDPETYEEVAEVAEPEKPKRAAKGTGEFAQIKLKRKLWGSLKAIASFTGRSTSDLLEEIVSDGIAQYKDDAGRVCWCTRRSASAIPSRRA